MFAFWKIERKIQNGIQRKIPRVRNIVLRFLCTLGLEEFFFKVITRRPPIDFLFTKAHCSHIMNFKNYILLHIVRKCSCSNFVVHCKTIISSLKYSTSHLLCGMSMAIFLLWAKPWIFSILLFTFLKTGKMKEGLK